MFEKFKDQLKLNSAKSRLFEERIYELVSKEIESGQKRVGLWAKALATSDGSEERAKSKYIKLRVQSMKDELELDMEKQRAFEEHIKEQTVSEEEKRIKKLSEDLKKMGCKVKAVYEGWKIYEPLGGVARLYTLSELESYAERMKERKF
tara:strand:- start:226 stop:672 length:447 start_codon:yes stop_codon:yes gene_type:complete